MKKLAIVGASLALAAMPVVGVFAAAEVTGSTDTLEIKVDPTCSFTTGNQGETTAAQTFTDTVLNGQKAAFKVGANAKTTHKFNVVCNANKGWKVTAAGQDLSGAVGNSHKISMVAEAVPAANSGTTEGKWSGALSGAGVIDGGYIPLPTQDVAAPVIATKSASTAGSAFTVTYDAYVGTETAADTYTGTVTYSLSAL